MFEKFQKRVGELALELNVRAINHLTGKLEPLPHVYRFNDPDLIPFVARKGEEICNDCKYGKSECECGNGIV